MAEYLIQGETLTAIADAIREHSNTTLQLTPQGMADHIELVYDAGYDAGCKSVLAEFADWSISTTSSACTVTISNTHPSLYLHLGFDVEASIANKYYSDSVIVPPNSTYSWDEGELTETMLSSESWNIDITEMRFSTNGI
jgi:hypothetical protein